MIKCPKCKSENTETGSWGGDGKGYVITRHICKECRTVFKAHTNLGRNKIRYEILGDNNVK